MVPPLCCLKYIVAAYPLYQLAHTQYKYLILRIVTLFLEITCFDHVHLFGCGMGETWVAFRLVPK